MTELQSYAIIILLVVNILAIMRAGWTISRTISRLEMKVNLMWSHYCREHQIRESDIGAAF